MGSSQSTFQAFSKKIRLEMLENWEIPILIFRYPYGKPTMGRGLFLFVDLSFGINSNPMPNRHLPLPPLKLVDGAKGNGFLKIDSIQLNWNSEHAGNEAGSSVNNWIDQTDLTKRGNPWKTDLFLARPSPSTHVKGLGRAWATTYLRQLTLKLVDGAKRRLSINRTKKLLRTLLFL